MLGGMSDEPIQVTTTVNAPLQRVWDAFNTPEDIMAWNHASEDWHCPASRNDLRVGGSFASTMAARDGSLAFEFGGEYTQVRPHEFIEYRIADGRMVCVTFERLSDTQTRVTERFDAEGTHPRDMQQTGWQAILDNFKRHAEQR